MRTLCAVVLAAVLAGCGGDGGDPLVISAAASLSTALESCRPDGARISFAGSDELAAQIRRGVRPGVFAAANAALPAELHAAGLAQRPRPFATNELVVAVPRGSAIDGIEDLAEPDVTVAIGAPTVPVGAYTRDVLARLDPAQRRAIGRNVRSEEPDVNGVVGKVAQGAADAGIVYATDAAAAGERLRAVRLPASLRPRVTYAAAVVRSSPEATAFLDDLVAGRCARALRAEGFGPP